MKIPQLVLDVGDNHAANFEIARSHIAAAAVCGASVCKFQKRSVEHAYTQQQLDREYGSDLVSYSKASPGGTYRDHRNALEFTIDQHAELKKYAESLGIQWATSVWDLVSAREVIGLGPEFIKVPSMHNQNQELLFCLRDEYAGQIHVSLGITSIRERRRLRSWFESCLERLVIYSCVASYPTNASDVCAGDIQVIKAEFSNVHSMDSGGRRSMTSLGGVGLSGHWRGIAIDQWAVVYGCDYLERHFMLDHTLAGPDVRISLEPGQVKKLTDNLRVFAESGASRDYDDYLECEREYAEKYRT